MPPGLSLLYTIYLSCHPSKNPIVPPLESVTSVHYFSPTNSAEDPQFEGVTSRKMVSGQTNSRPGGAQRKIFLAIGASASLQAIRCTHPRLFQITRISHNNPGLSRGGENLFGPPGSRLA